MKRILVCLSLILFVAGSIAAQFAPIVAPAVDVSNLYEVVYEAPRFGLSNSDYVAQISGITSPSGNVKILLKKTTLDAIRSGRYRITLEQLFGDFYRIVGTDLVVEISYGFVNTFKTYILDSGVYSLKLHEE